MKNLLQKKVLTSGKKIVLTVFSLVLMSHLMAQSFSHPGILHSQDDFNRMAEKVNAEEEPWISSYDKLVNSEFANLSWSPRATATIIRGGTGDNVSLLYRDVAAAYHHAILWKITGNTAYGDKAVEILNNWSSTHTSLTGNADRYLASGLFSYQFANIAEIMRDYSGFDVPAFQDYLLNVYYYPLVERFLIGNSYGADHNDACVTNYWANWDLANMAGMLAVGVFCDDTEIYNKGIEYFKNGAGNGCISRAVPFIHSTTLGQWQESGRDQGHSILGIGLMASFCEIAWNQGDDMYSYDDSRFRKGAEYVAKYNLGHDVPFTTYVWYNGTNCSYNEQTVLGSGGRGEVRPIWDMIYNHYANIAGEADQIPFISAMAQYVRAEGGSGGHATTFDQPGYGTLTHLQAGVSSSGLSWESYNFPGYYIRHQNNLAKISVGAWPVNDKQWNMVSGLADTEGVSFESVNYPGYYLRHYNYNLILDQIDTDTDKADATFYLTPGLADNNLTSFESYNFPGKYIKHDNYNLIIDEVTDSIEETDATFKLHADNSYVQIKNRATGLLLDGMGRTTNGDSCGQYANTTHVNSQWKIIRSGSYYQLKNVGTALLVDGMGLSENGSTLGQYANTTHENAHWQIQAYDGKYFRIQNVGSTLFIDGMGRTSNGANCAQWANTTSNNAQWEIIPVSNLKSADMKTIAYENEIKTLKLFPIPATSTLTIEIPQSFDYKRCSVEVFNMNGIPEIQLNTEKSIINLDISSLNNGIYVIIVSDRDNIRASKFVKGL